MDSGTFQILVTSDLHGLTFRACSGCWTMSTPQPPPPSSDGLQNVPGNFLHVVRSSSLSTRHTACLVVSIGTCTQFFGISNTIIRDHHRRRRVFLAALPAGGESYAIRMACRSNLMLHKGESQP